MKYVCFFELFVTTRLLQLNIPNVFETNIPLSITTTRLISDLRIHTHSNIKNLGTNEKYQESRNV